MEENGNLHLDRGWGNAGGVVKASRQAQRPQQEQGKQEYQVNLQGQQGAQQEENLQAQLARKTIQGRQFQQNNRNLQRLQR